MASADTKRRVLGLTGVGKARMATANVCHTQRRTKTRRVTKANAEPLECPIVLHCCITVQNSLDAWMADVGTSHGEQRRETTRERRGEKTNISRLVLEQLLEKPAACSCLLSLRQRESKPCMENARRQQPGMAPAHRATSSLWTISGAASNTARTHWAS